MGILGDRNAVEVLLLEVILTDRNCVSIWQYKLELLSQFLRVIHAQSRGQSARVEHLKSKLQPKVNIRQSKHVIEDAMRYTLSSN